MATTTNLGRTAVEHDTELLRLLVRLADARKALASARAAVLRSPRLYAGSSRTVDITGDYGRIVERGVPVAALPVGSCYWQAKTYTRGEEGAYIVTSDGPRRATVDDVIGEASERTSAAYEQAVVAVQDVSTDIDVLEEGYTGWNRYFLVVSSAGHVHRSTRCSTCTHSTAYMPLTALSGKSDADAVALLGERLCSVCFPDAPVGSSKIPKAAALALLMSRE